MRANGSSRLMSSPSSGNGPASHGSPDTKLTAFSPEDMRTMGRSGSGIGAPSKETGYRQICSIPEVDPFLAPVGTPGRMKLSPAAKCFTPGGLTGGHPGVIPAQPRPHDRYAVGYLSMNSEPDTRDLGGSFMRLPERKVSAFGAIGNSSISRNTVLPAPSVEHYGTDRRSRAFAVENIPNGFPTMSLATFFHRSEFHTVKGPVLGELSLGKVYIAFTDSREAKAAITKVRDYFPEWRVVPLTAREYVQHSEVSKLGQTSDFEGQLLVTMFYDSRNFTMGHTVGMVLGSHAKTFGDIKVFATRPTMQQNVAEFHLEFFDIRDAENAMLALNGASIDNCVVHARLYKPDLESPPYGQKPRSTPIGESPRYDAISRRSSGRVSRSPYMELSPTGRSALPADEHATLIDWMSRSDERLLPSFRREISRELGRYSDPRSSRLNSVDTERIRLGVDVRTTIMLRNIPNKIDQAMLKAIVDETSRGKYDFMYLRIDFANNCNVGYAFINFVDPLDIITFVNARAGRAWNCFNSDKVAEVSYATIQGKDSLVQKFRNSSVMLEHPSFRPKIFHTGTGPLAGTEDRFPGPDNPSKMRRSIENAGHLGLFGPRVSQQYRDEQRRRRSQFDRGTTAAEREDVIVRSYAPIPQHYATVTGNIQLRSAPLTYPAVPDLMYDPSVFQRGPTTS